MKKLLLFILPVCVFSQDVRIGSWKNYLSYNSGSFLCEANDKVYCVASNGLYYVDKEESYEITSNYSKKIFKQNQASSPLV